MSDNDEALLDSPEEEEEYNIKAEEEEALLLDEEDLDESGDVLELSAEETLNEDVELNETGNDEDDDSPREKFSNERTENNPVPDTTTATVKPNFKNNNFGSNGNRGKFNSNRRNNRGNFRAGGGRGRGGGAPHQKHYPANNKIWLEGNKSYFINPHFKGNVQIGSNGWGKPVIPISPQPHTQPPINNYSQQIVQPHQQPPPEIRYHQPQNVNMPPPLMKAPVHQRLGFTGPPPPLQQVNPFMNQMPPQFQPERIVTQPPPPLMQQPPVYQNQYNQPPVYQNHWSPPPTFHPPPQNQYNYHFQQPHYQPPEPAPMQFTFQNENYTSNYEPPPHLNYQVTNNYEYNNEHHGYMEPQNYPNYNNTFQKNNNRYISPLKRRKDFVPDNKIPKRRVENTNLQEVQTVTTTTPHIEVKSVEKVFEEDEDEESKAYRRAIEKQKRDREAFLAIKEQRRKQALEQGSKSQAVQPAVSFARQQPQTKFKSNPNLRVINATEGIARRPEVVSADIKHFLNNRQIIAKDNGLPDTSIVVVSNLAAGTTEVKLRKLCQGVGVAQNIEMSPKERQATIEFKSVASAHAFYKKYQRFMLDLSMIQVALKPT